MGDNTDAASDWWQSYPLPEPLAGHSHVRVNFIVSIDGAVTIDGRSGPLGGQGDRELMRVLRSLCDVLLVGAGTIRAEGYGGLNLPEPHQQRRIEAGLSRVPRLAIVTSSLNLHPDMSVFTEAGARPVVVTHAEADPVQREALAAVADIIVAGEYEVNLGLALAELRALGMSRVLSEGGPEFFESLLEDDLVDEVCLTVSPVCVGGSASRITRPHAGATASANAQQAGFDPRRFAVAHVEHDEEGFVFLRYARKN